MKNNRLNIYKIKIVVILPILFLSSCMKEELVAEDKKIIDTKDRGVIHMYYDGKEQKRVTLLPDYVAEFSTGKSKYRELDKGAQTVVDGNRVKIHKVGSAGIKSFLSRGSVPSTLQNNGDYSPVFSSNGNDSSLMTLPGSIIIEMDKDLSSQDAENWAKENKIKFQKKLPLTNGFFYVFDTQPGFSCLDKANELRTKSGVISSSPEWYQKAFPR